MAKQIAKSKKTAKPEKRAGAKQPSLSEEDIRRVVERIMVELKEQPGWTLGCYPPLDLAKHVVRQGEALQLLDYFIKVATSTRQAVAAKINGGWMQGCEDNR